MSANSARNDFLYFIYLQISIKTMPIDVEGVRRKKLPPRPTHASAIQSCRNRSMQHQLPQHQPGFQQTMQECWRITSEAYGKSELYAYNKMIAYNIFAISVITPILSILMWNRDELVSIEVKTIVRFSCRLVVSMFKQRFRHVHKHGGGILHSLIDVYIARIISIR